MEIKKFANQEIKEENGKKYQINTFEIGNIELTTKDINLIYDEVMNDDLECAYENGMYSDTSGDISYIDIEKFVDRIKEFIDEYEEENGLSFDEDCRESNRIKEILEILNKYVGWDLYP